MRTCEREFRCPISTSASNARFTGPLTSFHFGPLHQRNIRYDEVPYLNIFRNELVEDIAGNLHRPAWKRLILQGVRDEAALCHLAVAHGALSYILDRPRHDTPKRTNIGLVFQHYNKGVSYMQRLINESEHDCTNVILLCAFLCICFEIRYQRPYESLLHLHHALRIFSLKTTRCTANDLRF